MAWPGCRPSARRFGFGFAFDFARDAFRVVTDGGDGVFCTEAVGISSTARRDASGSVSMVATFVRAVVSAESFPGRGPGAFFDRVMVEADDPPLVFLVVSVLPFEGVPPAGGRFAVVFPLPLPVAGRALARVGAVDGFFVTAPDRVFDEGAAGLVGRFEPEVAAVFFVRLPVDVRRADVALAFDDPDFEAFCDVDVCFEAPVALVVFFVFDLDALFGATVFDATVFDATAFLGAAADFFFGVADFFEALDVFDRVVALAPPVARVRPPACFAPAARARLLVLPDLVALLDLPPLVAFAGLAVDRAALRGVDAPVLPLTVAPRFAVGFDDFEPERAAVFGFAGDRPAAWTERETDALDLPLPVRAAGCRTLLGEAVRFVDRASSGAFLRWRALNPFSRALPELGLRIESGATLGR
jgi:hypothetical protein